MTQGKGQVPDSLLNIVPHQEARATPEEVRLMAAELQGLRAAHGQAPAGAAWAPQPHLWLRSARAQDVGTNFQVVDWEIETDDPVAEMDAIYEVYQKSMGKSAPDAEMAKIMEKTRLMLFSWWAWHRDTIRSALVGKLDALAVYEPQPTATAQAAPAACAVAGPTVFGLQWPDDERINLSTIFDTEYEANKFILERCSTPGIRVVRLSEHPTPAAQADSVLEDASLLHYALVDGGNQSMNWQDVYDDWNGEGYFIDALRAAYKQDAARKQGGTHD